MRMEKEIKENWKSFHHKSTSSLTLYTLPNFASHFHFHFYFEAKFMPGSLRHTREQNLSKISIKRHKYFMMIKIVTFFLFEETKDRVNDETNDDVDPHTYIHSQTYSKRID
jgi:hypothetical protein